MSTSQLVIQHIIADEHLTTVQAITDYFASEFAVKVKHHEKHGLLLFMYDQIDTDFSLPGAVECRGIILRDSAPHDAVCVPFFKFFNIDERRAAQIDWSTARVYEKLDGSILKLYWHNDEWLVATNGTVDSRTTPTTSHERFFYDLFRDALPAEFDWNALNKECSYMFELMHPDQLIVVEHSKPRLVHIGTRNNRTLLESYEPLPTTTEGVFVEQARSFPLASKQDCIAAAAVLGSEQEGFVVVDAQWNRVKIKGPIYVSLHHMAGKMVSVEQCAVDIFLNGESDEVRAYRVASQRLLSVSDAIDKVEKQFRAACAQLQKAYEDICNKVLVPPPPPNAPPNDVQKTDPAAAAASFSGDTASLSRTEPLSSAQRKAIAIAATEHYKGNKTAFGFLMSRFKERPAVTTSGKESSGKESSGKESGFEEIVRERFSKGSARKDLLAFFADMGV